MSAQNNPRHSQYVQKNQSSSGATITMPSPTDELSKMEFPKAQLAVPEKAEEFVGGMISNPNEPVVATQMQVRVQSQQVVVGPYSDPNKLVRVRPRQSIPKTRIGNNWYSFVAGKECMVPEAVRQHLEEKSII